MRAIVAAVTLGLLAATPAFAQFRSNHRQQTPAAPAKTNPDKIFPYGATWVLQSIKGKPVGGDAPSFSLDETLRARGFGGCNAFSLTLYPVKDQKLAGGAVAMTRKTCDKATMTLEHDFLVGLHSLPKWDVSPEGTLTVTGATGPMTFRRGV